MQQTLNPNSVVFAQAMLAAITLTYGSAFIGLWLQYRREAMRAFALAWLGLGCYSSLEVAKTLQFGGQPFLTATGGVALRYVLEIASTFTAMALVNASYAVVDPARPRARLVFLGAVISAVLAVAIALDKDVSSAVSLVPLGALASALWVATRAGVSVGRPPMMMALGLLMLRPAFGLMAVDWTPGSQPAWYTALQLAVTITSGFFATVAVFAIEREAALLERVRLERGLAQSQRMDSMGRMASSVAHDFNNILATVQAACDSASEADSTLDERHAAAADITGAVSRGSALTHTLLSFTRPQVASVQVFNVAERLRALVPMLERLAGHQTMVTCAISDTMHLGTNAIHADAVLFDQVLLNLTANARDAMPNGGMLAIRCDAANAPLVPGEGRVLQGRYVRLTVTDTGVGMARETAERIFEPFFTTKEPGKGTGLGLATVFSFVRQAEGEISVESALGKGATFTLLLPVDTAVSA